MSTLTIEHAPWCQPTGDRSEVRTESYRAERTNADGVVVGRPMIHRCLECGEQTVQG